MIYSTLDRKPIQEDSKSEPLPIRVVSTFGSDTDIIATVKKYEGHLSRTRSFSGEELSQSSSTSSLDKKLFQFVKKTGSNLRSRLVKSKHLALGMKHGATKPCKQRNCGCCKLITSETEFKINGKRVRTAPGTCTTYNVIYLVHCKICSKAYVGRTVRLLRTRIGEHRQAFYKIIKGESIDMLNDDFSIGIHLFSDHGLKDRTDFNDNCTVCIIDNASPNNIEVKEHKYIHLLKTLRPLGINTTNPFKLPLLHT